MPVVDIVRDNLFTALGRKYTDEEFMNLCFDYGIELDEITSQKEMLQKERQTKGGDLKKDEAFLKATDDVIYKIEIPANRYDLLCEEGLVRALKIFQEQVTSLPAYTLAKPLTSDGKPVTMRVKPDTAKIRPFVVSAILRNITFTQKSYDSFIELQDKLHQNICRKRTLVAIGTHDLDTIKLPLVYDARKPEDIEFIPLTQNVKRRADKLMTLYEEDPTYKHLKPYVSIIKNSPVYPVILDSAGTVLSLPPLINGEHSKITLNTKNVLIECTATDHTKALIVLNTMVTMFSEYCAVPFTVEPVQIVYPDGHTETTPDLSQREFEIPIDYINSRVGIKISADEAARKLRRMQLDAYVKVPGQIISAKVPPTRSDILHIADVMEDVAISYGYNKIVRTNPKSVTIGQENALNAFGDLLRAEFAMAGYTEILTLILCSHQENFEFMRRKDDGKSAVTIANPKTAEFQVCRTSLLPGLLKTAERNVTLGLPLQIFEISDVVRIDSSKDVGASNRRHAAALYCSTSSGFEQIHGLLDRLMEVVALPEFGKQYTIKPSEEDSYFPGRQAQLFVGSDLIGSFGVVHPEVLLNFGIKYPCSVLEVDLEALQKHIK